MNINELYDKWTAGDFEKDNPFIAKSEWKGNMVYGFVSFCLKECEKEMKGGK